MLHFCLPHPAPSGITSEWALEIGVHVWFSDCLMALASWSPSFLTSWVNDITSQSLKLRQMLWGPPGYRCFLCFLLFVGKRLQPPRPSLSTNRQLQTVANQGKEGMQKQEEQPRNKSAALEECLGSPSRDTHTNIFEFFCRSYDSYQGGRWNCMPRPQISAKNLNLP